MSVQALAFHVIYGKASVPRASGLFFNNLLKTETDAYSESEVGSAAFAVAFRPEPELFRSDHRHDELGFADRCPDQRIHNSHDGKRSAGRVVHRLQESGVLQNETSGWFTIAVGETVPRHRIGQYLYSRELIVVDNGYDVPAPLDALAPVFGIRRDDLGRRRAAGDTGSVERRGGACPGQQAGRQGRSDASVSQ